MEREIILDTETTGLDPKDGHRIVEIGCIELINRLPTGKFFHHYINPQREIGFDATRIHGITNEMVKNSPKFEEIVDDFLNFVGDSKLVIHNADFDMKFINAELFYAKKSDIKPDKVFCTLKYARKKFSGAQNSLDALCKRFGIDNSHREKHGALLDSELLAEVYLELMGGRQNVISLQVENNLKEEATQNSQEKSVKSSKIANFPYRKFEVSEEEKQLHKNYTAKIKDSIWAKIEG
ncbi:MAG: DNA polymerase III subunit epsilon [Rickettsiales bacterium]|nr:DNA polymerase III subunit epsilon [Rickettsiales bacterium]